MEVILFFIEKHKFINRGFLIGPYCPIYGVCAVLMVLTFDKYLETPFALFVMAAVVCSTIEYLTSYLMEKLFNTRWWDYSNLSFNINGRICLKNSLLFGILGIILIYFVNPALSSVLVMLPQNALICIALAIFMLFVVDNITSFNIISRVKETTNLVLKDSTEEITEKVKSILRKKSSLYRRLLDAYPNLKAILKQRLKEK